MVATVRGHRAHAEEPDDVERMVAQPGVEAPDLGGPCGLRQHHLAEVPEEGVLGVVGDRDRPGGPDGFDGLDRVVALVRQDGVAERRPAVDPHVAVGQHDRVAVSECVPGDADAVVEELVGLGPSVVVGAVVVVPDVVVPDVGCVLREERHIGVLAPAVDDVGDAGVVEVRQMGARRRDVVGVQVVTDGEPVGDQIEGALGFRGGPPRPAPDDPRVSPVRGRCGPDVTAGISANTV